MTERTRNVLLTGVTGVLGSAILGELLRNSTERVVVIIRSNTLAEARERLAPVLRYLNIDPVGPMAGRIEVICGDLAEPRFGMDEGEYQRLSTIVTDIIHAAGNVKLDQPIELARRDAVIPTQHLIALAKDCLKRGPFGKCEFVSTVGVSGQRKGAVPEAPLARPRTFHNTYEEAKAESEDIVLSHIQSGFPATIHRPSMIVGESESGGVLRFQVFHFFVEWSLGNRCGGILPNFGNFALDIIPVDYVAKAIVLSNRCPEAKGQIFHLCSGPSQVLKISDLQYRARRLAMARGYPTSSTRTIYSKKFWRFISVAGALIPGKIGRAAAALPFLLNYLEDPQPFENAKTTVFFSAKDIRVPPLDSYLDKMLNFYFEARERRKQRR